MITLRLEDLFNARIGLQVGLASPPLSPPLSGLERVED